MAQTPILDAMVESSPIVPTSFAGALTGETPMAETPMTETPMTETPMTETPMTETPMAETPIPPVEPARPGPAVTPVFTGTDRTDQAEVTPGTPTGGDAAPVKPGVTLNWNFELHTTDPAAPAPGTARATEAPLGGSPYPWGAGVGPDAKPPAADEGAAGPFA